MSRPLPYTALRAFEAVSRLGSFSDAASDLGVSQSAVSQHVKSLEAWLGHPLLVRSARGAAPTRDGAALAVAVAEGLGQIAEACDRIRTARRAARSITISCLPGFAFIWLFPRLLNFDLAHPNLTISVTTDTGGAGFSAGGADIGIRYGGGQNPGFAVEPLIGETLFPVCAPSLLEGPAPLRGVADLAHHTLLRDEFSPLTRDPPTWEYWAKATGEALPEPARSRRFGQSNLVMQAAISGLGVALGRTPLVDTALEEGRLVRPFGEETGSMEKYWLVYEERARKAERITLFLNWIKAEADGAAVPPAFRPS